MTSIYTQETMLFHTTFYVTNRSAECGEQFLGYQKEIYRQLVNLAWGQQLSIQGRASFSGSGVEEDRRVNQRVLNFPIAENPIFSLAIAKKPHSSCHKSTSSKACPAWHSA